MQEIKLIALDVDGTLYNDAKEISPGNRRAIEAVMARGITVTLATGRAWMFARPIAQSLGVDVPLICSNGAMVRDSDTVFVHENIEQANVEYAAQVARHWGSPFYAFDEDRIYASGGERAVAEFERWSGRQRKTEFYENLILMDSPEEIAQAVGGTSVKLLILDYDQKRLGEIKREINQDGRLLAVSPEPFNLDIANCGVTKATGLQKLAARLGIPMENVMAFGDGENDLEMLQSAAIGVAMANAPETVRQRAGFVTKTNEEDGVAFAIEKFCLGNSEG